MNRICVGGVQSFVCTSRHVTFICRFSLQTSKFQSFVSRPVYYGAQKMQRIKNFILRTLINNECEMDPI
jgi:hypothetical protein